jgi:hypothetical protein
MNESAMLPHIIQCPSEAVPSLEHREGTAKTTKTQLLNPKIWSGGGNKPW